MKKTLFIILAFSFLSSLNAQELNPMTVFSKAFEIVNEKNNKEKFKGQILKGKRNGMGYTINKKGDIYAGDFYRGGATGFAMLITSGQIANCDSCFVYVGNWKDGKKSGFGVCYAENGDIIYQGQFADDKPIGVYPSENPNLEKYFTLIEIGGGDYFLGEMKNGNANGFGVLVFNNGDLWQSSFKDGQRKGIGLYLAYNGEWETLNVKGDDYDIVSSSENYRNMDATRKANFRSALSGAMGYFAEATQAAANLAGDIQAARNGTDISTNSGDTNIGTTSGPIESRSGNTGQGTGHNASEVQSKNKDSNTYSSYEFQLIKMNTYWESQYNDSQRRNIQQNMKKIRTKWESRGFQMFHSQWEDWDGKKR